MHDDLVVNNVPSAVHGVTRLVSRWVEGQRSLGVPDQGLAEILMVGDKSVLRNVLKDIFEVLVVVL